MTAAPPPPPGASPKGKGADRNGNGRIDPEDILIFLRDLICWIVGWRGAMLVSLALVGYGAHLNIVAWQAAVNDPYGGFLIWATLQLAELMPVLDDLSLHSALAALVRLQRKPLELPTINETANPHAKGKMKRYLNRERNLELLSEFARYFCYGLELSVLILASRLIEPTGIQWAAVGKAAVGILAVEVGLRLFSLCAEKLLSPVEREALYRLRGRVSRQTTSID